VKRKGFDLRGLYAVTAQRLPADHMLALVGAAIRGGARLVQYRDKTRSRAARMRQAGRLLRLCRAHALPLLVNDDVELAARVGAHGVHLGRDDDSVQNARAVLGEQAIIGVSCYNRPELALQAQQAGADYVAFGRFFASHSKPEAVQADVYLLRDMRSRLDCPIVAIGGITAQNGRPLVAAGADMLAVIHGLFGAEDVASAAAELSALFDFSV